MYREFLIFAGILVVCLFMTIHNNNLKVINNRNTESEELKINQENFLMNKGMLIKLSNGVTLKKNSDLIIIEQSDQTIIINAYDSNKIAAFLESN